MQRSMSSAAPLELFVETLWISPYTFSSFVALKEKGLEFEVTEVSLLRLENRAAGYRDASVTAKVPALRHDGFWVAESSAIAEYLDEAFPAPAHPALLPAARRDRARARQLMAWLRSDLGALRDERPTTTMFYDRATKPLSAAGEEDAAKLLRVAASVVPSTAGPLFGAWALVDSELAFMLQRLLLNGHAVPEPVRAYAEAQWQRASVREFVQHARPAALPEEYWALPWNVGSAAAPPSR